MYNRTVCKCRIGYLKKDFFVFIVRYRIVIFVSITKTTVKENARASAPQCGCMSGKCLWGMEFS